MIKLQALAVAGAAALAFASSVNAAPQPTRVRGEIQSIADNVVDIHAYSGEKVDLALAPETKYVSVVPSNLSDIKPNDFVGVGATGPENHPTALEVVIFPESMRGTGEGHRPWSLPGEVAKADGYKGEASKAGSAVQGTMTNGTVAAAVPTQGAASSVHGTMTNGTVASTTTQAGGRDLTVSYSDGKKVQIRVPANAPVVRLVPAERSVLAPGAKAFAVAAADGGNGGLTANFVAVGANGLMPPM